MNHRSGHNRHPIENAQCGWVPIYGLFIGGNSEPLILRVDPIALS